MQTRATMPSCKKTFTATGARIDRSSLHGSTQASRYLIMLALGSALVACSSADSQQELVQISVPAPPRPVVEQRTAAPPADRESEPAIDDQDDDANITEPDDDPTTMLMAEPEPLADETEITGAGAINAYEASSWMQGRGNEAGSANHVATDIDGAVGVALVPINYAGSWTAINSDGSSCRATLSMAKAGDARRASTSGCAGDGMAQVSAWDLRGDTLVLLGSGSAAVARFAVAPGAMNGTLASTGTPVTMSR